MKTFYHGTTSKVVPLIEIAGLLPGAPKIYSKPSDISLPYDTTFGGVYVSRSKLMAKNFALHAVEIRGGQPVIYEICADIKSDDVLLDEDEIIEIVAFSTDTYSWDHLRLRHESIYKRILDDVCEDNDDYFRCSCDVISSFDFYKISEKIVREISPNIDIELTSDMMESASNLIVSYGVHLVGTEFVERFPHLPLPDFLQSHFSDLVNSVNVFSGMFPEIKTMQEWTTFRIMSRVPFGHSNKNSHWIVGFEYGDRYDSKDNRTKKTD